MSQEQTTYTVRQTIPSAEVPFELLKDLEAYILRRGNELAVENKYADKWYQVTIVDSGGKEELGGISEYQQSYLPDNTKSISLTFKQSGRILITTRFDAGINESLDVAFKGPLAKETVMGLLSEIQRIIAPYRNRNSIFHNSALSLTVTILMLVNVMFYFVSSGAGPNSEFRNFMGLSVLPLCVVSFFLMVSQRYLKPYHVFYTRRNEKLNKWWWWWVTGVAAFLIFTVGGVYLRKSILHF
jgi:hypothetical protein